MSAPKQRTAASRPSAAELKRVFEDTPSQAIPVTTTPTRGAPVVEAIFLFVLAWLLLARNK